MGNEGRVGKALSPHQEPSHPQPSVASPRPQGPTLPFLKARNSKTLWTMDTMMVSASR